MREHRIANPRLRSARGRVARSSPGAPHRGGGLPASEPGLVADTHDLNRTVEPMTTSRKVCLSIWTSQARIHQAPTDGKNGANLRRTETAYGVSREHTRPDHRRRLGHRAVRTGANPDRLGRRGGAAEGSSLDRVDLG